MKITFKPFDWKSWEDNVDGENAYHIEIYGHNKESEPTLVRVEGFTPWCYAELPEGNWDQMKVMAIHSHLNKVLGNDAPLKCFLVRRKRYYYYRGNKTYPLLLVSFKTESALRHFAAIIKKPLTVSGMQSVSLTIRENNISQVKKLCAMQKINYICWLQAEAEEVFQAEERSINNGGFMHEYIVNWRDLRAVPEQECSLWRVNPTILSWDIETLAYTPKTFPNALNIKDQVVMIGFTFAKLNDLENARKYLLTVGKHADIPGVDVRRYACEEDLLSGFCQLILECNPDITIGHNIYEFDFPYMNKRLSIKNRIWDNCSRIKNRPPNFRNMNWSSSAYGANTICYLQMDGRISIDTLPLIRRDYKLSVYNLDFCAKTFLKKSKIDLDKQDMFRYFKLGLKMLDNEIKEAAEGISIHPFQNSLRLHSDEVVDEAIAIMREYRGDKDLRVQKIRELYDREIPNAMALAGKYCSQDTIIPIELFIRLNSWLSISELSSIVKTTIMESFTRGQQIRNLSQTYDLIYENGMYLDSRVAPSYPIVGAYVHHPEPGLYENVISFDFASLYPSIIIAYNICPTTYVPPEIEIDESLCHIIEWEEKGLPEKEATVKAKKAIEDEDSDDEDEDYQDKGVRLKKMIEYFMTDRHYRFRFVKAEHKKGLLPQNLQNLLAKRKATKAVMEMEPEDSDNYKQLNIRQNNYKVSANSGYGGLGAKTSLIELVEGAMCVTAIGRENIHKIMDKIVASKGIQVYGDTDSCMVNFPDVPRDQIYEFGKNKAKELSIGLPPPMKLEFERAYADFFILSAKRYANVILRPDGTVETDPDKIYKKGIVLARRDNCVVLRSLYKQVLLGILYHKSFEEVVQLITDFIRDIFSGNVPLSNFVIVKGLNSSYKSENVPMLIFARRMKEMGKLINPGERVGYVLTRVADSKAKQGERMVLPEIFEDRKGEFKIDYLYYFEKQLMKPIQQLMEIAYHVHPNFMKKIYTNFKNYTTVVDHIKEIARKKAKSRLVIVRK